MKNYLKKLTALAMSAVIFFGTSSCMNTKNNSGNESESVSNDVSSETSEVIKRPFVPPLKKLDKNYDFADDVDRTLPALNVATNKSYTYSAEPSDAYPDTGMKELTDGTKAQFGWMASFGKDMWVGIVPQGSLDITLDLGAVYNDIADISLNFCLMREYAINAPENIKISVSNDGESYDDVGYAYPPVDMKDTECFNLVFCAPGYIEARYVKLSLYCPTGFIFLSELEVRTYSAENPEVKVIDRSAFPGSFGDVDALDGVRSMALLTMGVTSEGKYSAMDADSLMPIVNYMEDGEIKDHYFDSFIVCAWGNSPSGGSFGDENGGNTAILSDYNFYHELLFKETNDGKPFGLTALDYCVGEAKNKLGDSDYKAVIYLSVIYPGKRASGFGDLDGDGKDDPMLTPEQRLEAAKFGIDEQMKRFEAAGYENLELGGFYWLNEAIGSGANGSEFVDEQKTVKLTNDYLHSVGMKSVWIPYFGSRSAELWGEYGFDYGDSQPNYAFGPTFDDDMMSVALRLFKSWDMGVELEMNAMGLSAPQFVTVYREYLRAGIESGFMNNQIHILYHEHGGTPGMLYSSYKSNDPYLNSVYKDTYLFLRGQLDVAEIKLSNTEFDTITDYSIREKIDMESPAGYAEFTIFQSPSNGTLRMNKNGSFVYTPYKGYVGNDSFVVSAYDGVNRSKLTVVTVKVEEE